MKLNYELLKDFCLTHAVSGDTSTIANKMIAELKKRKIPYTKNGYGTLVFGKQDAKIMFTAHMDEVGFQVTKINEDGKLSFLPIGWVFPNRLDHNIVYVYANGKKIPGLVVHCEELKTENLTSFASLCIDVGAVSKKEVEKMGVVPGCTGSFEKQFIETETSIIASSIDNKISQFAVFHLLDKNPEYLEKYAFAFITDEEMQDHSANGICHSYLPELAVVLDYCPIHQKAHAEDVIPTEKGPLVLYRGGGYIIHEEVRKYFDTKIKSPFNKVFFSSATLPVLEPSNFEENGTTKGVNVCVKANGYHGSAYTVRKDDIEAFITVVKEIMDKPFV